MFEPHCPTLRGRDPALGSTLGTALAPAAASAVKRITDRATTPARTCGNVGRVVDTTIFASAARAFSGLVDRLPQDGWDAPGLGVWDLRALTGHASRSLITVSTYLKRPAPTVVVATAEAYYASVVAAASAGSAALQSEVAERGRAAGEALGADPAAAVRSLVSEVLGELAAVGDDPVIETIGGGMRLSAYLPTRIFEMAVHSLDIASATGVEFDLPDDVLDDAVALAGRIARVRGDGVELLMSLTGRRQLPDSFSVV